MTIENAITIAAPIGTVWALTTDVEAWPSLMPTVTSVELITPRPIALGSRAKIKQPRQRLATWTVDKFVVNQDFAWSTKIFGTKMTGRHELSATASGTENRLSIEMVGPTAAIVRALTGKAILKAITTENECFKRVAEGK